MAPLSVLFEGASLLVAATAVVALEGLLYCEQEFQLSPTHEAPTTSKWYNFLFVVSYKTDDVHIRDRAASLQVKHVNWEWMSKFLGKSE